MVIAQVLPCFGKIAFYEVAQIIHFSNLISLEEALSLPSILSSRTSFKQLQVMKTRGPFRICAVQLRTAQVLLDATRSDATLAIALSLLDAGVLQG